MNGHNINAANRIQNDGFRAYAQGFWPAANPYAENTAQHEWWAAGHEIAACRAMQRDPDEALVYGGAQ